MSHSTVLVIGEDPEKLLEPYDESTEVVPYREYVDAATPQDHWQWKGTVEECGLAPDAGWSEYVAALNSRYPDEPTEYDAKLDRAYHMSTYNPLSRWDWYQLGGRWTGYFDLRPGATGKAGEPGLMTSPARGRVDRARKRDIDFGAMRERHAADARREIREVLAVLKGQPPLLPWARYRDEWPDDIDGARRAYHVQPGLKALSDARLLHPFDDPTDVYCLGSVEPETAYVAQAARGRTTPFAVLTDEGWAEKGRTGWFGVVHDEKDQTDWTDRVQSLIDAAPDDALFSLYDVHI